MTNQELREKMNQVCGEWGWMIITTNTGVEITQVLSSSLSLTIAIEKTEDAALRTACRNAEIRQAKKKPVTA